MMSTRRITKRNTRRRTRSSKSAKSVRRRSPIASRMLTPIIRITRWRRPNMLLNAAMVPPSPLRRILKCIVLLKSSIGYDKGCKYDKGYGYARAYDCEYERCDDEAEHRHKEKEFDDFQERHENEFFEHPEHFEEKEDCKEDKDFTKCETDKKNEKEKKKEEEKKHDDDCH